MDRFGYDIPTDKRIDELQGIGVTIKNRDELESLVNRLIHLGFRILGNFSPSELVERIWNKYGSIGGVYIGIGKPLEEPSGYIQNRDCIYYGSSKAPGYYRNSHIWMTYDEVKAKYLDKLIYPVGSPVSHL